MADNSNQNANQNPSQRPPSAASASKGDDAKSGASGSPVAPALDAQPGENPTRAGSGGPSAAETSGAGKAGAPASASGTPGLAPGAPTPELQHHQLRTDGVPGAEPPIVGDPSAPGKIAAAERGGGEAGETKAEEHLTAHKEGRGPGGANVEPTPVPTAPGQAAVQADALRAAEAQRQAQAEAARKK